VLQSTCFFAPDLKNPVQEIAYCDLHSDALTATGKRQVTGERLSAGGCFLQCLAVFIEAKQARFRRAEALMNRFPHFCRKEGLHPVTAFSQLKKGVNALLTVEGGGVMEGKQDRLDALYARGVRMMTLTWNDFNELGAPCFPDYRAVRRGMLSPRHRETRRGLTAFGFAVVEKMISLGMIIDVAHGSDRLVYDVASACGRRVPFIASHAGAAAAFDSARNLTDGEIAAIADSGGVVGLYCCDKYLSRDVSADGQRDALLHHARAIFRAGGGDVMAFGSDFDGISPNAWLPDPSFLPRLRDAIVKEFGFSVAEKMARKNFLRVFSTVCP